jgi:hypothetical protein
MLRSLNGESWIDMDSGALSLGNGALTWNAADGFQSLSAKRIQNSPTSTTYGEIGTLPFSGGEYPSFYLTGTNGTTTAAQKFFSVMQLGEITYAFDGQIASGAPKSGYIAFQDDGSVALVSTGGGVNLLSLSPATGLQIYAPITVNGLQGENKSIPIGNKTLTVTNGIVTSYG